MSSFEKLKVGDEVLLKTAINYLSKHVEKVTDKYIVIEGKEYKKENGVHKRGPWFGEICIPTADLMTKVKKRKQANNYKYNSTE